MNSRSTAKLTTGQARIMNKTFKTPIRNFSLRNILKCQERFKISNGVKILIISIAVFGASFLLVNSAQAQNILGIQFQNEPDPLFQQTNFLPGNSTSGWVKVTNISTETQKIGVEIINKYLCSENCLSDVLNLSIAEEGSEIPLLEGSLTTFYKSGEKPLSDLAPNTSTTYYFSITFNPKAGNNYQGSEAEFDIKIGAFGKESISGEIIPGGGPSGGGGVIIAGLQILNETASDIQEHKVTITWLTNEFSTSRVIYSPGNLPHLLQVNNPPNYGYVFSTIEDSNKVTGHTVVIDNLSSGTTYYFRCVSHASLAISQEYSFTTLGEKEIGEIGEEIPAEGIPYEEEVVLVPTEEEKTQEEIIEGEEAGPKEVEGPSLAKERSLREIFTTEGLLAAIGAIPFNLRIILILAMIIMVALLVSQLIKLSKKRKKLKI
jgi:hypothetical protein